MHGVHRRLMFPLWIIVMISFFDALYGLATDVIQLPNHPSDTAVG